MLMNLIDNDLRTPFEKGNGNQSTTYQECISYYEKLDGLYNEAKLTTYGTTSIGKPLHLMILSRDKIFDPVQIRKTNKRILLINNGIHPGEPDGIDASMMFARDILVKKDLQSLLDHVVIIIIPVYNVSGMLNRGSSSRANQNGPEEYGFRGTAQNYDLNRDFVKCDSREAQTFTQIFQEWKPEIFIDTHVSDGADYQYTMTLISTQPDKLNPTLSAYQEKVLLPDLNAAMKDAGYEVTPYVNPINTTPDSGIVAFLETPRFSTGYAALFNCIGMMPETHMLKPYKARVFSTYHLLMEVTRIINRDYLQVGENKESADLKVSQQKEFALQWNLDENNFSLIPFKGFTAEYRPSEVSGQPRLYYNKSLPYEQQVKYFNHYTASEIIEKPFGYIVPQAWEQVIRRLTLNGVQMVPLSKDTFIKAQVYYIDTFNTSKEAYEGHYIHSKVTVHSEEQTFPFFQGDYLIPLDQPANRYIVEMLEPQGVDSYFAWNFFDPILMEKEYFSDYVWEEKAAELLKENASLKNIFENKKIQDISFAKDQEAQLYFIYTHSTNYEKSYRRYPVVRIIDESGLK
ncbi:MAG: M14 family metallopeptidase [Chitinophagales bacterium]|nr:M14 family metallopeptidase [Chitinophagales bacterium]